VRSAWAGAARCDELSVGSAGLAFDVVDHGREQVALAEGGTCE